MASLRRDAPLALLTLLALVGAGVRLLGTTPFVDPRAVRAGVLGALALEWGFLAAPSLAAAWERRGVPLAAGLGVVTLALLAARAAPWLVGAAAWGLVTYLARVGCVLAGWGNPLRRAVPARWRE